MFKFPPLTEKHFLQATLIFLSFKSIVTFLSTVIISVILILSVNFTSFPSVIAVLNSSSFLTSFTSANTFDGKIIANPSNKVNNIFFIFISPPIILIIALIRKKINIIRKNFMFLS